MIEPPEIRFTANKDTLTLCDLLGVPDPSSKCTDIIYGDSELSFLQFFELKSETTSP